MDRPLDDPTDADYAAAARWALRRKDLPLAIQQVSAAISINPLHEPYLHLLDEIVARAKGHLLLVKLPDGDVFFGLCAARARVLARLDRLEEALRHLFEATAFSPSTPFLPWARAWVESAKRARTVSPDAAAAGVLSLIDALRARRELDEGAAANLEAALHVARKVRGAHPASTNLRVAEARVLRLLRRHAEALRVLGDADLQGSAGQAGRADGHAIPWEIAVERAAIHRELGQRGAEVRALEQAVQARPREAATQIDLGDTYLDDGRPEEAAAAYALALALDASFDGAQSSAAYARALASEAHDVQGIGVHVRACAASTSARVLSLEADLTAYATRLADPSDPVVGVIRGVRARAAQVAPPATLRFRVRAERPLAPSARIAFAWTLALAGREGALSVEHPPGAIRWGPLWKAAPDEAHPAVPRPPDEVLDRVLILAQMPFAWAAWCRQASELSASFSADHAACLVDAMAYPPRPPSGDVDVTRWVYGFQIAAALLVALRPEPAGARRERLEGLLLGLDDWSAGAALLGFRALASAEPQLRAGLLERARALLPPEDTPLPPLARALAIIGCDLASGGARRDFLRLRARIRSELADLQETLIEVSNGS